MNVTIELVQDSRVGRLALAVVYALPSVCWVVLILFALAQSWWVERRHKCARDNHLSSQPMDQVKLKAPPERMGRAYTELPQFLSAFSKGEDANTLARSSGSVTANLEQYNFCTWWMR